MPILLKVYYETELICVYVYEDMKTCIKHTNKLVSYYDLNKKSMKYNTYKRSLVATAITRGEFKILRCLSQNKMLRTCK